VRKSCADTLHRNEFLSRCPKGNNFKFTCISNHNSFKLKLGSILDIGDEGTTEMKTKIIEELIHVETSLLTMEVNEYFDIGFNNTG